MLDNDAEALGATDDDALGATATASDDDGSETAAPVDAVDPSPVDAHERKLTSENRGLRKRLRELEAKEAERATAEMTDTERLTMQLADKTKALQDRDDRIRSLALSTQIAASASKFGIVDTDAATKLVDVTDLEYDDETARWVGVDDALRSLAQDRPWLTAGQSNATGTNPTNPPRRRSTLTADDLRKMTDVEIDALSEDEINAALTNGR